MNRSLIYNDILAFYAPKNFWGHNKIGPSVRSSVCPYVRLSVRSKKVCHLNCTFIRGHLSRYCDPILVFTYFVIKVEKQLDLGISCLKKRKFSTAGYWVERVNLCKMWVHIYDPDLDDARIIYCYCHLTKADSAKLFDKIMPLRNYKLFQFWKPSHYD